MAVTLTCEPAPNDASTYMMSSEPGQNVTLTCKGSENNPVTFLKLTQPDLDPEYVLVYRDDRIDEEIQNPRFKGRTELQSISSSDGNVNVILHNVTEDDSGTYKCFVESKTNGAKTSERIIKLRDTPGNSGFYVAAACALMIFIVSIVAVALIRRKNKKLMSSPLDEAVTIQMTPLKLNVSATASSTAQCPSTLSLVNEN
uniref:Ig-like domain-containing protein n=1 Tax=Fundulus heteroclitus TaxID=8078 RepID=A0A3Q2PDR8_FUNHE